jgi:hypothetical protein
VLGGGGGRQDGWGNAGGGVLFLRASAIGGDGRFESNGNNGDGAGTQYHSGGGGAGGTIDVRVRGALSCRSVRANGGAGGSNTQATDNRAGGGGSGGRIFIDATTLGCTPEALAGLRGNTGVGISNWSQPAAATDPLFAGEVVVSASPVDAGTASASSVAIFSPIEGVLMNTPRPVVNGRANALVRVLFDGVEAGTAPPLPDGGFLFLPAADLADGPHRVRAQVGSTTSNEIAFSIDTEPPPAPEVLVPRNGAVLATATPSIEGNAPVGTRLELLLDGRLLFTQVVPGSGTFLTAVPAARFLEQGAHSIDATAFDQAGNFSRSHIDFTVGRTPMDASPTVQSGCATTHALPWSLAMLAWLGLWRASRRSSRHPKRDAALCSAHAAPRRPDRPGH